MVDYESLEGVDAVLGCPIYLFEPDEPAEGLSGLPAARSSSAHQPLRRLLDQHVPLGRRALSAALADPWLPSAC